MCLTLSALQSGWKENHTTFIYELKNLQVITRNQNKMALDFLINVHVCIYIPNQATGLSSFGRALKECFNLLNLHRLHTCIDHYGQVQWYCLVEPFKSGCHEIVALTGHGSKPSLRVTIQAIAVVLEWFYLAYDIWHRHCVLILRDTCSKITPVYYCSGHFHFSWD